MTHFLIRTTSSVCMHVCVCVCVCLTERERERDVGFASNRLLYRRGLLFAYSNLILYCQFIWSFYYPLRKVHFCHDI